MTSSPLPRPAPERLRVGVVGAGRVGAVLSAALREAGHDVVAAAGESDASRSRIDTLLPGVPVRKPSAVARACDLLLLTVPDDMLANVVSMLAASGALRPGQYVAHTSGRHGLSVLQPAADLGAHVLALHPAMTFTGTALDNALDQGDAALTGPIVRGDVETVRAHLAEVAANAPDTLPSYVAMARATLDRVVTDGRVLPIRAARIRQVLDLAVAPDATRTLR